MKKKKSNCIIAIETSCDDTSIACIKDNIIVANKVITRNDLHLKYGGIIPELASRNHAKELNIVFNNILNETKISMNEIDYVAYTAYPGLIGCLHTGKVLFKPGENKKEKLLTIWKSFFSGFKFDPPIEYISERS